MKTLAEMIQLTAEGMFNEYMGGGEPRAHNAGTLATVYGVSSEFVSEAIYDKLDDIKKAYYNSPEVKALKL